MSKDSTLTLRIKYDEEKDTTILEAEQKDSTGNLTNSLHIEFKGDQADSLHKMIVEVSLKNGCVQLGNLNVNP